MLDAIPRLVAEGVVCDACVTDPPYCLGFMGMKWDGDIAARPDTWATVATVLRPGAFLVAFGGTRTYHRLASAIEDAGFVIQDTIAWIYGTGFPKNRNLLKPAFEPIVLAYKPCGKRTMQVDECRIGTDEQWSASGVLAGGNTVTTYGDGLNNAGRSGSNAKGRWPANVCHDGSDEVLAGFPQAGGGFGTENRAASSGIYGNFSGATKGRTVGFGDTGSAARFFYCAKASKAERAGSRHPTVKPVNLMRWLVRLTVPPGGLFIDPFAGSGTAAVAARYEGRDAILIEREPQYVADIQARIGPQLQLDLEAGSAAR